MTIKNSGNPLSFQEIEAEFGSGGGDRRLGKYRRTDPAFNGGNPQSSFLGPGEDTSQLGNKPLDDGIPSSGEIKFSDFYGKKLNLVIDYYDDTNNLNKEAAGNNTMAATWRYDNQQERVKVIGGFRDRPLGTVAANYAMTASDWQGGKKIIINVNQTIGGKKGAINDVALRTGNWPTGTELKVDIGPSGYLTGAGGNGGDASGTGGNADGGENGSSALFQVIMSLIAYQKAFSFTHNDLHTNNVVYNKTEKKFLYYKYDNIYMMLCSIIIIHPVCPTSLLNILMLAS